jgi:hypothetical protein
MKIPKTDDSGNGLVWDSVIDKRWFDKLVKRVRCYDIRMLLLVHGPAF